MTTPKKPAKSPRKSAKTKVETAPETEAAVTEVPEIEAEVPSPAEAEETAPEEAIELTAEDEFDEDAEGAADEEDEEEEEEESGEDEDDSSDDEDEDEEEDADEASDEDEETGEEDEDELSEDSDEDSSGDEDEDEPEFNPKPRPPAKLERLQKILAKSGVASRRKAEEMIEQGRVQVNGKIITALGTKADLGRDHIRVDGKLLGGAERLRYFVLNKPKGFVTTVKDPEGRPTVMQFFDKMKERLYPVGRLDYMSEGLLVVTNDGELANRLTKASSGVEKTYLVKVAGQPSEDELDILRGGVAIERGKPGSGKVRTSPARIRQVRQGDNPWYEVVLIEGRNRELRKMFEEVGHFVEKIRRVGYGPLVLDQEPGNMRELRTDELDQLRLAAEGKLRTPKSKELRRRNAIDAASLPTVKPMSSALRSASNYSERTGSGYRPAAGRSDDRSRRPGSGPSKFGPSRPTGRPAARPAWQKDDRPARPYVRPNEGATGESRPASYGDRPSAPRSYSDRPTGGRSYGKPAAGRSYGDRPSAPRTFGDKPAGSRPYGDKPARPFGDRPSAPRSFGDKPAGRSFGDKPAGGRSYGAKPAWNKSGPSDRPAYKRPAPPPEPEEELGPRRPSRLKIEPIQGPDRSSSSRPSSPRPYTARPSAPRSYSDRPSAPRSYSDRPSAPRPQGDRESSGRPYTPRPSAGRPPRSEGGLPRAFTTSSGKPRAGGARPSSKPGKSYGAGAGRGSAPRSGAGSRPSFGGKRTFDGKPAGGFSRTSAGSSRPSFRRDEGDAPRAPRPYTPRAEGDRPSSKGPFPNSASRADRKSNDTGWKPKTRYGGSGKPASGGRSKPGGGSGYKGKPSGGKRPGGKRY
jgi:23S rRNA pseudouridine2605 synthase